MRPVRSALVRRLVRPAAILLIPATLSGCSRVASAPPPDKQPVTLRFGIALPPTGSPGSGVSAFVNNFVSDPIIGIGWNGRPVDRLVGEDVLWSDDGLQLSIRLEPNLKFHDGTPIDRAYFRQRLESILKSPQIPGTNISYQSVTSVELDPETKDRLIIRLSRPEGFLPTDLANSTFPHPTDPNIGTGPYKVVTAEPRHTASCV